MRLNLSFLSSYDQRILLIILKTVAALFLLVAFSSGLHAYVNSEYNRGCRNGVTVPTSTTPPEEDTASEDPDEAWKDLAPVLWMERYTITISAVCMFLSIALCVVNILKEDWTRILHFRTFEFIYHFVGSVFLILATIFMGYSAGRIKGLEGEICLDPTNCQRLGEKICAATFCFLAAFTFIAICIKQFGSKLFETITTV